MNLLFISSSYPSSDFPEEALEAHKVHELYKDTNIEVFFLAHQREKGIMKGRLEEMRFKGALKSVLERTGDYDALHLHYPKEMASIISKRLYAVKTPIMISLYEDEDLFGEEKRDLEILLSNASLILTPSEVYREKLLGNFLLNPDQVKSVSYSSMVAEDYVKLLELAIKETHKNLDKEDLPC